MRTTARYSLGTWLARVLVVMAVVWLALFLIHVSLPNVRPGRVQSRLRWRPPLRTRVTYMDTRACRSP